MKRSGRIRLLRGVGDAVLGETERALHAPVARPRSDSATPGAHRATEAQVEDHLASFLTDLAGDARQHARLSDDQAG